MKSFRITYRQLSSSKAWLQRHVSDQYVKKASDGGLRARSAFKLKELQDKYKLIKKTDVVVDLGCAPGGWSVVAAEIIDPKHNGLLISLDLLPMDPIPNCHFLQGDMLASSTTDKLVAITAGRKVNVVLSDMMANTCGDHATDHYRSMDLCYAALEFAKLTMGPGGSLLCKYFRGEDENDLIKDAKEIFSSVKSVKPKASRSESSENFLFCQGKKL